MTINNISFVGTCWYVIETMKNILKLSQNLKILLNLIRKGMTINVFYVLKNVGIYIQGMKRYNYR